MKRGKSLLMNPALRPAAQELWDMGYRIRTVKTWEDIGVKDALGVHMSSSKIIMLVLRRNGKAQTLGDLAFVLAHELRHAQHHRDGIFKTYYDREKFYTIGKFGGMMAVGYRAELDCDAYARQYVKRVGIKTTLVHRTYSKRKVAGYCQYRKALLKRQILSILEKPRIERDDERLGRLIRDHKRWTKNYMQDRNR